jgi:NAD(P)-dependent dehydrogenase (short-subunit alcohol dehydrogenase family)
MITGAGSGIGRAVAERLHARGDALYLLARSAERAEELRADFPGAHTLIANLADPYTLADGVRACAALPDEIDGLLHVAGAVRLGTIADLSLDDWHVSLAVNLGSPAELTRLLLPRLRHPGGHVVFVNSTSGLKTQGEWAAYSAGKYGLRAIADCLRDEEGATGLRVTTVYPSRTATPMQERVNEYEGRAYEPERWIDPGTLASTIIAAIDLPADAEVADLTVRVGPGR